MKLHISKLLIAMAVCFSLLVLITQGNILNGQGKLSSSKVTLKLSDKEPHKGNPYIKVKVNGIEGLFLIDTGMLTKDNTISKLFASKCNLSGGKGAMTLDDGNGNSMLLENQVLDITEWGGGDGCLGRAFYGTVKMMLDYPERKVTFERYSDKEEKGWKNGMAVPFRFLGKDYNGPFIDATIDGKKVLLIVDTGANWSSLNTSIVDTFGLKTRKEKGNYDITHVKLSAGELMIADAAFARLTNSMLADMSRRSGENIAGIIGNNILNKYRITFDYKNKQVIFCGKEGGQR